MKTLLQVIAITFLLGNRVQATDLKPVKKANIKDSVSFAALSNRDIEVSIKKLEAGSSTVNIYNEQHDLIFSDRLKTEPFIKKTYFLPDYGVYYFSIDSKHHHVEKKVTIGYIPLRTMRITN